MVSTRRRKRQTRPSRRLQESISQENRPSETKITSTKNHGKAIKKEKHTTVKSTSKKKRKSTSSVIHLEIDEEDITCCLCNCNIDFSDRYAFVWPKDSAQSLLSQASLSGSQTEEESEINPTKSNNMSEMNRSDLKRMVSISTSRDVKLHQSVCELESTEKKTNSGKVVGMNITVANQDMNIKQYDVENADDREDSDYESSSQSKPKLPHQFYDPSNAIVLCDTPDCGRAYHQRCHFVPIFSVPRGQWHCLLCQFKNKIIQKPAPNKSTENEYSSKSKKNLKERKEDIIVGGSQNDVLSKALTLNELETIFLPLHIKDKKIESSKKCEDLNMDINRTNCNYVSIEKVAVEKRFEFQSRHLKSALLHKELSQKMKSFIDQNISNIRLSENAIRSYTELARSRKSLQDYFLANKRLPQEIVQSMTRLSQSKLKIRSLMLSLQSYIRNENSREKIEDFISRKGNYSHDAVGTDQSTSKIILSDFVTGDFHREEPRFDIDDYDGSDDEIDEDATDKIKCCICYSGDVEKDNDVVMCDGENCFRALHMKCVTPHVSQQSLDSDKSGTWFCPYCTAFANWIYYIQEEYYGDEFDERLRPRKIAKGKNNPSDLTESLSIMSWENASEIFPEADYELSSVMMWKEGLYNSNSLCALNELLGFTIENKDTDSYETSDNSDESFLSGENDSESSSSNSTSPHFSSMQWDICDSELEQLSKCSSNDDSSDDMKGTKDGIRLRSRHITKGSKTDTDLVSSVGSCDVGQLDVSNIILGKRKRTKVDYRRLNDALFGDDEDPDIDGGDLYHNRQEPEMKTNKARGKSRKTSNRITTVSTRKTRSMDKKSKSHTKKRKNN